MKAKKSEAPTGATLGEILKKPQAKHREYLPAHDAAPRSANAQLPVPLDIVPLNTAILNNLATLRICAAHGDIAAAHFLIDCADAAIADVRTFLHANPGLAQSIAKDRHDWPGKLTLDPARQKADVVLLKALELGSNSIIKMKVSRKSASSETPINVLINLQISRIAANRLVGNSDTPPLNISTAQIWFNEIVFGLLMEGWFADTAPKWFLQLSSGSEQPRRGITKRLARAFEARTGFRVAATVAALDKPVSIKIEAYAKAHAHSQDELSTLLRNKPSALMSDWV